MIKCISKEIGEVAHLDNRNYSIELKIDGSRQFWIKGRLFSERGIDNTLKFKHISDILKDVNAILDGEIYLNYNSTVFDVNKKINRNKVKYCVFDILELNGESLRDLALEDRQNILRNLLDKLNKDKLSSSVHFIVQFPAVDVAWDFITDNKLEGLVIKRLDSFYSFRDLFEEDRRSDWIKCKFLKEGKEKIIDYDRGSVKGAFTLENGSRISALKSEVGQIWLNFKDIKPIYAEFQYLNKTESGAFFQPVLHRLVDGKGNVLWE